MNPANLHASFRPLLIPTLSLLLTGGLLFCVALYLKRERLKRNGNFTPEANRQLNKKGWEMFFAILFLCAVNILAALFL